MTDLSIKNINNYNTSNISNNGTNCNTEDLSIFLYNGGNKKDTELSKENLAKLNNYKKTKNDNIYYDKQNKQYYRWNPSKNVFELLPDAIKIHKDGSYDTKERYIIPNGNYLDKLNKKYYDKNNNEISVAKFEAEKLGYQSTKSPLLFFDANTNKYFFYTASKYSFTNFRELPIEKILENGAFITKSGETYDQIGNKSYVDINGKKIYTNPKGFLLSDEEIKNFESNIKNNPLTTKTQNNTSINQLNIEAPTIETKNIDTQETSSLPDGAIGDFKQGKVGDCWLLAAIKSISLTKNGKNLLKESLKVDDNGNVTIYLKGVNKSYYFSAEELKEKSKLNKYASGDMDVLAIELAFEKFRKEIYDTGSYSKNRNSPYYLGVYTPSEPLYNGDPKLAIEILTGKKGSKISKTLKPNVIVKDNIADVGSFSDDLFKDIFDNKNNMITVVLKNYERYNYSIAHALVFKSYDNDNVYLIDPIDTKKDIRIPKKEFYTNLNSVVYTNLNKNIDVDSYKLNFTTIQQSEKLKQYLKSLKK